MTNELGYVHQFSPGTSDRTLLLLHGTGGNEQDLIPLGQVLDPAAALLSPRGPVLEKGRARFFRRLSDGVFDLEDLQRRTGDLSEFVRQAARKYQRDPKKIIAVGYSNGANIAASVLLREPGVLAAAVLLRAMAPFEPVTLPDLSGVRVWIAGGERDSIIPAASTKRLAELLEAAGAEVTAHWVDAGHELTSPEFVLAKRWLS